MMQYRLVFFLWRQDGVNIYHDNLIFAFFFLSAIEQEKKG